MCIKVYKEELENLINEIKEKIEECKHEESDDDFYWDDYDGDYFLGRIDGYDIGYIDALIWVSNKIRISLVEQAIKLDTL